MLLHTIAPQLLQLVCISYTVSFNYAQMSCRVHGEGEGRCTLLVQCASFFGDLAKLSRSPCSISYHQQGVCCPSRRPPTRDPNSMVRAPRPPHAPTLYMTQNDINRSCDRGIQQQRQLDNFEKWLVANNIVEGRDSAAYQHSRLFQSSASIRNKGRAAALVLMASKKIKNDLQLSPAQATFSLARFSVRDSMLSSVCPPRLPACSTHTRYRTTDGSCNNINNPDWGSAGTTFRRLLPPVYADGIETVRVSAARGHHHLPSARSLSAATVLERSSVYDDYTLFVMQWGQFLDHDLTHTPIGRGSDNSVISCCSSGNFRSSEELHPECLAIAIPEQDQFYSRFGQRCMNFVRSMPAISRTCTFGPRQQMNQITSYLDASNVYGSSVEESQRLRLFRGGELKQAVRGGRSLLPPNERDEECQSPAPDKPCFGAGDTRVNEQPNLTVLHTVWMRQHNLLARQLSQLNPSWSDEILFQETRAIVAAQMQHITYNEYLPIVLGQHFVETFGLVPQKEGYSNSYDPSVDATISNAFATAAFRYGHTLIDSNVQGYSRFGTQEIAMKLRHVQFFPFFLYDAGTHDALVRGLAIQSSQKFDNFFSEELTNHLFARNNSFGMDLVALNLQRGRDHGLPAYVKWRNLCNLRSIATFADLRDVMPPDAAQYLSSLYKKVEDIDLFLGGILEFPVAGALVGHTFLCILGEQFHRLKAGDRFYYENGGGVGTSFSPAQLQQIRQTSLARVLCDTADDMVVMQPLAFLHANFTNKRTGCQDNMIPSLDLNAWRA
uniref:Peroxidase-like n=1 Tax=Hirondellea gigas TaxID=1518452 RepID=A0A6A7FUB4_9CRUS